MKKQLHHARIALERAYPAPVERVFAEFADPHVRAKWSPPSNDALVYDEADFVRAAATYSAAGRRTISDSSESLSIM